jgi:hypothetical protein
MEELKGRCLIETGLKPPMAPQFPKWALKAVGASHSKEPMISTPRGA